jgi:hypothetical protein
LLQNSVSAWSEQLRIEPKGIGILDYARDGALRGQWETLRKLSLESA